MTSAPTETRYPIESFAIDRWDPDTTPDLQARAIDMLEAGSVLFCPNLAFTVTPDERRVLDTITGRRKSITMVPGDTVPRGIDVASPESAIVKSLLERFAHQAETLICGLLPEYRASLIHGRMSYRPAEVSQRPISDNRYDDRLLHVDAFPSQPTRGARILRVFSNVNAHGESRIWRLGEPFERAADRFKRELVQPFPGMLTLQGMLKPARRRRTPYDHLMLQLHDRLKLTAGYQQEASQAEVHFPPDTSWIVFTDQVLHAALAGRQMLEKTFYIPVAAQRRPERSPLRVLERLTERPLAQADGRDISAVRFAE